jgi:hypothetical protein
MTDGLFGSLHDRCKKQDFPNWAEQVGTGFNGRIRIAPNQSPESGTESAKTVQEERPTPKKPNITPGCFHAPSNLTSHKKHF